MVGIVNNIKLTFNSREIKAIDKILAGYDRSQPYPMEVVDKGGAIGEELY